MLSAAFRHAYGRGCPPVGGPCARAGVSGEEQVLLAGSATGTCRSGRRADISVTGMPITDDGITGTILVCDGCGRSRRTSSTGPIAWDLLWLQANVAGWAGSDRALGPHYCTVCAEAE